MPLACAALHYCPVYFIQKVHQMAVAAPRSRRAPAPSGSTERRSSSNGFPDAFGPSAAPGPDPDPFFQFFEEQVSRNEKRQIAMVRLVRRFVEGRERGSEELERLRAENGHLKRQVRSLRANRRLANGALLESLKGLSADLIDMAEQLEPE
jgi:hypothetical protein